MTCSNPSFKCYSTTTKLTTNTQLCDSISSCRKYDLFQSFFHCNSTFILPLHYSVTFLTQKIHTCIQMHINRSRFKLCLKSAINKSHYGKAIQKNQLDATMIYWSMRSAQHVSGNISPIIRSVRLRYLQHMASEKEHVFYALVWNTLKSTDHDRFV